MIELINVIRAEALDGTRLRVTFSNGRTGVRDLTDLLAEGGPMVEPLRDPEMFRRVFVQMGVPTWPNGFDLDAIRLHDEMEAAGLLGPFSAAPDAAEASMLSKVIEIRALSPFSIRVRFSDGTVGVHDCSPDTAGDGPMVKPLKDPTYFARVFLERGAPTWPNGWDMCPHWLQQEMRAAGELQAAAAE